MKQFPVEKSSVAWFRLAECLKRKERERAFMLYRLLIHSYEDQAFLKKLEGDMWIEFDIVRACECYCEAARLYTVQKEYYEAFLMYKQLIALDENNQEYQEFLVGCLALMK